ncbi:type II toxin-antitoxin system VapC family toxin [Rhizobium herbae]|jgi:predicted nucleic acid-binding protein
MILADTSVWIRYIRFGESDFSRLLMAGNILMHPFVMGELALGSLKDRFAFLEQLRQMIQVTVASDGEVMQLIESRRMFSTGIGYADAHLLTSISLSPGTLFWTFDKRLRAAAEKLSVSYLPSDY